jgi:Spy/CpxP family protein refolding chaperone
MKTIILSIIMAFATATAVQAQDKQKKAKTPEQRAEMLTNKMETELKLDATQKAKVLEINKATATQLEQIKNEGKPADDAQKKARRERVKTIEAEREKQFAAILTPEQMAGYKKMKEDGKEKIKERREERKNAK